MLLRYLYTISEPLCFNIEFRVLRYRCFFVGSSLGCLLGTGHRFRCAHCTVNQSSPVPHAPIAPPGQPSATTAEAALGGAAAAGAERRPAAGAAAAAAGAGINETLERVILQDRN